MSRRAFLGALPGVVLAGCLGDRRGGDGERRSSSPTEPSGPADYLGDFLLSNESGSEKEVTLSVESNTRLLLEETVSLLSGFEKRVANPIDSQGTYEITVSVDGGGRTAYTWKITTCRDTDFLEFRLTGATDLTVVERVETVDPQTDCPSDTTTEQR